MPATARAIEPVSRKADLPETYPAGRRCKRCNCELCIYNAAPAGLCWPCSPGSDIDGGVVIEVGPGEFRRFRLAERERLTDPFELADLIAEAP